ncbi:MAG: hypothetical protein AB8I08_36550 [Sandaracinaceae bacterium]
MSLPAALRRARRLALACTALVLLSALAHLAEAQQGPRWLQELVSEYRAFGRVDDELRWAPFLCRLPMPSAARVSQAAAGPHGRKVYFVYASDRAAYVGLTRGGTATPPIGFTVVKEAFSPRAVDAAELDARPGWTALPIPGAPETSEGAGFAMLGAEGRGTSRNVYRPIHDESGQLTGAGAFRGLYVMRYVGAGARTDAGWVYATIDADGQVTSSGLNRTCMSCHRSAPHGRLFGNDG